MQKITPFLWFDGTAEAAIALYLSTFKNARIVSESRFGEGGPAPKGTLISATFVLDGQEFMALNGGPHYQFSPAVSFFVNCETQAEIDHYWDKLVDGGEPLQCGWLRDRFGVTWQIVPQGLGAMLGDSNPKKAVAAMQAMRGMVKLDIAELKRAYEQA